MVPPSAPDSDSAPTVRVGAGRTVGPYQLLEQLGTGGMGEVWKARDRHLNRVVALKFISAGAQDSSARDLLHEARAASALNHPNIVTIFQIVESDGTTCIAMEFVEGETLRARLGRSRATPAEALKILRQIVSGLSSAHGHGIVHRDLKPENIMLRADGCVKLVDFGLAKLLPWQDTPTGQIAETSDSGQVVGTYRYMSPEQARGRPVSTASDVFSLGIVMYELLSGEHPFARDSVIDTLNAIIREPPPAVGDKWPSAPPLLQSIVSKALQKDSSSRYSSAVEVDDELERALREATTGARPSGTAIRYPKRWIQWTGGAALASLVALSAWITAMPAEQTLGAAVRSVAVMSFPSPPDDDRAAALAQGLPEDLGGALSTAGFQVASRSSVIELGNEANARLVGAELGVDVVLEGRVRSFGSSLRVYVELVSTRTRFQIWSGTFTSNGEDLAAGDQRLAAEIADRVRTALPAR